MHNRVQSYNFFAIYANKTLFCPTFHNNNNKNHKPRAPIHKPRKNQKDTTLKKRKAIRYSIHKVQVDIAFIRRGTIPAPTKISN